MRTIPLMHHITFVCQRYNCQEDAMTTLALWPSSGRARPPCGRPQPLLTAQVYARVDYCSTNHV